MKHSLERIVCLTSEIVAQYPDRVDARAGRGLAPRYVEHGEPCCLVAEVLARLGWSVSQLKLLDSEGPRKHKGGGVQLSLSRNPLLRRISPDGLMFLDYIQRRQDRKRPWSRVVAEAFKRESPGFRDRQLRPWVYRGDENEVSNDY